MSRVRRAADAASRPYVAGRYPVPKDYLKLAPKVKGDTVRLPAGTQYSTADEAIIERMFRRWVQGGR